MALANIAFELSKRNYRVLIIDWDLEAPGIERYFSSFEVNQVNEGLLQLLLSFENDKPTPDYTPYIWSIFTNHKHPISLITNGRDKDPAKYSLSLQNLDWSDFFSKQNGGLHLENLRKTWQNDFDFILIDSRTGLSDSSGICTILMPDILIPMFTPNYQSLFGIRDIVNFIQSSRQKLDVDRMALTVLPIPSRFGTRVEFKESQDWLERISDILSNCFNDWVPKWVDPKYIFERLKIPQIDYFSFGEKLAVVEQGTNDPEGMGYIYSKIADLLSSDFNDVESLIGLDNYKLLKKEYENNKSAGSKSEHFYDLFVSYSKDIYPWAREYFIPALSEYLNDELGYNPQIYFDIKSEELGFNFLNDVKSALAQSKAILIIHTENHLLRESNLTGIQNEISLLNKEHQIYNKPLFNILYTEGKNNNHIFHDLQFPVNTPFYDFSSFDFKLKGPNIKLHTLFGQEIEKLAHDIASSINNGERKKTETVQEDDQTKTLQLLAREYESVRKAMPSGNHRTSVMNDIVSKMKSVMNDSLSHLNVWTNSDLPGERLLAISKLQKFPNIDYLDWLSEHVGDIEKPFIGYQSSLALYETARSFRHENNDQVKTSLRTALENVKKYQFQDPNQVEVLESALRNFTKD